MRSKLPATVPSHLFLLLGIFVLSTTLFAFLYRTAAGEGAGMAADTTVAATDAVQDSEKSNGRRLEKFLQASTSVYLPLAEVALPDPTLLCRFGVNALDAVNLPSLADMRVGWYMNFHTAEEPPQPAGMEYMQLIAVERDTEATYSYSPAGAELLEVIAANPGSKWLIANEPDSPWQGNLTPQLYANAYHELYQLVKGADPTAQLIPASIIQATELRLLYLDEVLLSYQEQFGEKMPADGWSIHNYVLSEIDCDAFPELLCWGAFIPPGIDRTHGEIWQFKDNDRVDIFIERIPRFRQWLADNGYRGQPLYLTEYGVLVPPGYQDENGEMFPPARVNAFMDATYDYLLTATDPELGDPNDGYRLVQQWAWFSDIDTSFNGVLFDKENNYARTAIGDFYASYTAGIEEEVDFYPRQIKISTEASAGVTLQATIANSGNLTHPLTALVRFYAGHPESGGVQIGSEQLVRLAGCGENQVVDVEWESGSPGTYDIYVEVEPQGHVTDSNMANNLQAKTLVIPSK